MTTIRKGQASHPLEREAFAERFREAFYDPAFESAADAIAKLEAIAWDAYPSRTRMPSAISSI